MSEKEEYPVIQSSEEDKEEHPVLQTAKEKKEAEEEDRIVVLVTGIKARITPVSASLIAEVTSRVKNPEVPMWHNPDKDRDEPNPTDPSYIRALEEADRKRGAAAMDAMIMFGIELIDGLPEDESWLKKLRNLEKRGLLDLSQFDLEDEMDREFLYKRYVAVTTDVIEKITAVSGVSSTGIEKQERSFRRNQTR